VVRVQTQRDGVTRDIDDAEENLRVLIEAELEVQHLLISHAPAVAECPVCQRLRMVA
jgi:hypothetical protein